MFFQEIPPTVAASYVGILSPECEKQREIAAIQRDPRLFEKLGNQVILEIRQIQGGYLVITDLCEMRVDVTYLPPSNPKIIGEPQRFEFAFNDPVWFH
ncbi:MAG: hypothetical protein HW387_331 [Parachlamydiales bacterium]|nr:hypothetical protein [Parachlamydiales bacterium]